MKHLFNSMLLLCLAPAIAGAQPHVADHLVISELGIYATSGYSNVPTSAEYTEIYNPTGSPVDLTNYYISDHELHFDLPSIVAGQRDNTLANGSDFLLQFPAGAVIPAGGVVVVASSGSALIEAYFDNDVDNFLNQPGSPQLFEVYDSSPAFDNMAANYNAASADYPLPNPATPDPNADNMSHTDAGENCVLFYWDGTSSLIEDVDIVQWLQVGQEWGVSTNQYADKSARAGQGPGGTPDSYNLDFGDPESMTAWYPDWPTGEPQAGQLIRMSLLEVGETKNGISGNGITGDDETLELNSYTWQMFRGAPTNASPGITHLPLASENQAPVIGEVSRNVQYPTAGTPIVVSAEIFDDGAFTAQLMVDKGSGFSPVNMTLQSGDIYTGTITTNGLAPETRIRYYVTVTDNGGLTRTESDFKIFKPTYQPFIDDFPGYHICMIEPASPYSADDLLVTEVMYDPQGANNYQHAQFFELYNPAATPLNVGGFVITTTFQDGDIAEPTVVRVPFGTVIPANGYAVVVGNKVPFLRNYPGIDESRVIDIGIRPSNSVIAHAGSIIRFFGPNEFDFNNEPVPESAAFKAFEYANQAPWPEGRTGQPDTAGNTGFSIELTELTASAEADPTKWQKTTVFNGTPMADNSVDTALRPGDVEVTNVSRDVLYPNSSQSITISATPTGSVAISSAKVFVNTGGASYQEVAMTTSDGGLTYDGTIGPFADGTLVKYYVEAEDANGNTGTYPYTAPVNIVPFRVDDSPVLDNVLVLNEIMYDPSGGDNGGYPEFAELYNKGTEPVDLSYYQFGLQLSLDATSPRLIPEGTILNPGEYLVLAGRGDLLLENYTGPYDTHFRNTYGAPEPEQVIELGWSDGSKMTNGNGTTIYMVHPNEVEHYAGLTGPESVPFISLNYQVASPWPANGATLNGPSIELEDTVLDFTDPSNWAISESFNGTPGTRNSVAPPPASVSDWTLY